ncbi:hypothetical protein HBI64_235430 [Parastagonospora nodorum]|nr:hypothetical protein HBI64_235430 [Parastagonospora nodorum]
MTDSPRARTLINLSVVLYEQLAARLSLSAEVSNIDLDFVPGVAFIPNVYMADSLRARTLINLSAVLYEQAAARTGLPAEVSNMDLDFMPGVAFISDVHIADSLRARTPINLSAVLYEQAAARTGLSAEVGNISPRVRTLINLSAVLYEQADARSGLPAEVSIIDLDFVPSVAFNAMGNVELTGDLLGDADRVNNNNNNVAPTLQFSLTALLNPRSLASKRPALSSSDLDRGPLLAKRIKTDEDRKNSLELQKTSSQVLLQTGLLIDLTMIGDNIEELICVGKVKHTYVQAYTVPYPDSKKYLGNSTRNNRNNLNIIVTNPTGREFGRVDMKSLTRLCPLIDGAKRYDYYNLQDGDSLTRIQFTQQGPTPGELGSIYVLRIVSKSDEVPTREPSTLYFMWDKEQDHSAEEHDYRKFYRLVITGEDTHYKQTIKKAYIMSLERALLILFMT